MAISIGWLQRGYEGTYFDPEVVLAVEIVEEANELLWIKVPPFDDLGGLVAE